MQVHGIRRIRRQISDLGFNIRGHRGDGMIYRRFECIIAADSRFPEQFRLTFYPDKPRATEV